MIFYAISIMQNAQNKKVNQCQNGTQKTYSVCCPHSAEFKFRPSMIDVNLRNLLKQADKYLGREVDVAWNLYDQGIKIDFQRFLMFCDDVVPLSIVDCGSNKVRSSGIAYRFLGDYPDCTVTGAYVDTNGVIVYVHMED